MDSNGAVIVSNEREEKTASVRFVVKNITSLDCRVDSVGCRFWRSPEANLLGRKWFLRLRPEGFDSGKGTHFAVNLQLDEKAKVQVRYKVTIEESGCVMGDNTEDFDPAGFLSWGLPTALTIAAFKALAAAHNDTLTFKVEIGIRGEPTSSVQGAETAAVTAAAHAAVIKDLGALLDTGEGEDAVFRVGDEEISAHRTILAARSPVFQAMLADHWNGSGSGSSSSSSSSSSGGGGASSEGGSAAIPIEDMEPAVFKQLLRWIYTGQCEGGALAAMADHLYEAAGKFGLPLLQAAAQRQMLASLDAAKVCDYFALAHAHEDEALKDACAALVADDMLAVTQTGGFKRLSAERPLLLAALMQSMGELKSPEGRKRKRDEGEGGAGRATELTLTAEKVKRLKVGELRSELASRGLATGGVKSDLAARLEAAL